MSWIAIVLIIISAFMHVGWNLLSKKEQPSAFFFLIASLIGTLLLSPTLFFEIDTIAHISLIVWIFLIATGFFMALYYISLAGAYRTGDMSVAYPLARSFPVIIVLFITLVFGRESQISMVYVLGIVLVVIGCFLIPLQRFNDFHFKNYFNSTCGLALLAAVGTSGYIVLDDEALRQLRMNDSITIGNMRMTFLYAFFESLSASIWLFFFMVFYKYSFKNNVKSSELRMNKKNAMIAGIAIQLTYLLVLISLAFVNDVGYVVGFRQLSIPLGAALGILVLKEAPYPPKLAGVTLMFVGLILVAVG